MRDRTASWYQQGVPGLGANIPEVVASLRSMLRYLSPSRVITIGQSMGAYGALLVGLLLNADQIVAFGSLSAIDVPQTESWNDYRYHSALQKIEQLEVAPKYLDLLPLLRDATRRNSQTLIDLYYGTFPSDSAPLADVSLNHGAVHLDALHAERMAAADANCRLHPFPKVSHLIAQHLANSGEMDGLLRCHILDEATEAH